MDLTDPIHKKVIGFSFIIFSLFSLAGLYFYDAFMAFILDLAKDDPDFSPEVESLFSFIGSIVWTLALVFLIPRLLLGIALVTKQKWADIPSLIFGIISLLNFPVGTALGVYCILVFTAKPSRDNDFERRTH